MKVLVIGGTGFLGGAIATAAREAGHAVWTLGRKPGGPRHLTADRTGPMPDLSAEGFETVFDTCGFAPGMIDTVLDALGNGPARYVFVSSISAYAGFPVPRQDETAEAPTAGPEDLARAAAVPQGVSTGAAVYAEAYGPLKVACEDRLAERLGTDRVLSLRAGLLVGPGDYTDRMTWWVRRMDLGGRVPVPEPKDRPVQWIDVRDAGALAVKAAEARASGLMNLTGPTTPMAEVLETLADVAGAGTELAWTPRAAFVAAGASDWTDLPMILPLDEVDMLNVSTARAEAAGLRCRPLAETAADILAWDRTRRTVPLKAGMSPALEAAVLDAARR